MTEHTETVKDQTVIEDDGSSSSSEDEKGAGGRPASSDYSDIFDKNKEESQRKPSITSESSVDAKVTKPEVVTESSFEEGPVRKSSVSSASSADNRPAPRPVSSDYSDIFDKNRAADEPMKTAELVTESSVDE